ncbi:MAG: hypothetical protein DBY38_00350 [Clostridium cadaveris]|uniref:Metal-binding protein n=1 Tax=Clostridium cadaveris TaxID=1529 RepID=A0A316MDA0_9CLOT|nr:MAG: hypothetical protein DBY38_00350 [Clostridium cadaveris]
MIENIYYTIKSITTNDLMQYYNPKLINKYCESCNKYSKVWTCPPLPFIDKDFLLKYKYCHIISGKVLINSLDDNEINLLVNRSFKKYSDISISKDNFSNIFNGIYYAFRETNDEKILKLEDTFKNTLALVSGRCLICSNCTRVNNMPCIHPNKLRYSLESLGLDVSSIMENVLGEKLQWSNEKNPEYVTGVSALLSNSPISQSAIKDALM